MGEHVGAGMYPAFCALIRRQLRPGGRVLIQQMSRRSNAPGGGKFIEAYIAPDMHMRPVGETACLIEDAGLEVRDIEAMREHYPPTIRAWLDNLEWHWDQAVALIGGRVGAGMAAVPGRRGAGVRGRPDGRRPDPRGPAVSQRAVRLHAHRQAPLIRGKAGNSTGR